MTTFAVHRTIPCRRPLPGRATPASRIGLAFLSLACFLGSAACIGWLLA